MATQEYMQAKIYTVNELGSIVNSYAEIRQHDRNNTSLEEGLENAFSLFALGLGLLIGAPVVVGICAALAGFLSYISSDAYDGIFDHAYDELVRLYVWMNTNDYDRIEINSLYLDDGEVRFIENVAEILAAHKEGASGWTIIEQDWY